MSFKLKPKQDRIIIKPEEVSDISEGGIIIPDGAKERPKEATVIAVGPGLWESSINGYRVPDVRVGEVVMFAKYAGMKVMVDTIDYLIIKESDIVASHS
jgi:chaperonin GroES